ncbi:hypothetical protein MRB53_029684 [Persea americana]|uniref:Uncharacterized protein n=1 Tax=Persea americana TaxID=3435 RepID=A0ACC2KJ08_PERAE|nr:hypothetical protein MRB53_029684 [Persea americana]
MIKRKGVPPVLATTYYYHVFPSPHYNHLKRTDCWRKYPSCHFNLKVGRELKLWVLEDDKDSVILVDSTHSS